MNKLVIIGNLTANPETRYVDTASGQHVVCNFTVAVNRVVRDRKLTEYFRVSCWDRQADNAAKYLSKGSKVAVTGPVTARGYTSRDGTAKASLEIPAEVIEYLSSRQENAQAGSAPSQSQYAPQSQYTSQGQAMQQTDLDGFMNIPDGIDEELPFE